MGSGLSADQVIADLGEAASYLRHIAGCRHLSHSLLRAADIIQAARHVKVTPDGGDTELIVQLQAASRTCDSSLLELAALRLIRHLPED